MRITFFCLTYYLSLVLCIVILVDCFALEEVNSRVICAKEDVVVELSIWEAIVKVGT